MRQDQQHGFVLISAAVLLVVLTLVAVTAMKGTSMELRMSGNEVSRMEVFDASEAPRVLTSELLDVHTFNRGWPVSMGGDVPNSLFDYDVPASLSVRDKDADNLPDGFYIGNTEANYSPAGLTADVVYSGSYSVAGQSAFIQKASVGVYKLRTAIAPGAGAAMVAGYEGTGKAAAAAGGNIFYQVVSQGVDPVAAWNETKGAWEQDGENSDKTKNITAKACTTCDYRYVIRN
ncbi:MAG: hypothetical protein KAG72_06865 [Abyssibacter sp.]|nr:PilX N-terminal domain-containing pilus assembly protein [Abyssibacter sp.]MCK5859047.1 hypothetical protein [Abyssibacter sp.]